MENENKKDYIPDSDDAELDRIVKETMDAVAESDGQSVLDSGLEGDTEFQKALEALKAFSARYESSIPAEEEAVEAPVTQDTVQFTAPVVAAEDTLEKTQKFTPPTEEISEPAPEDAPVEAAVPEEKGRPARKKGYGLFGLPHLASTAIWLAIILTIGISLGRMLWVCASDLLAFGKPDKAISITIEENDGIKDIAKKLADAGIIRYPNLFVAFADITGKGDGIIPDTYTLNSKYDYNALLKIMSYVGHSFEVIEIMIPEGYNCAQIFKLLEENGVCSVADLEEWAANGELNDYWFLEGVPRGTKYCLEGYLYPDTYEFYLDDEPRHALEKFLNGFEFRFTEKMYNDFIAMQDRYARMLRANGYSSSYVQSHKLTFHQLVTMASIVEEEKATGAEGYDISAVFYNRLASPNFPRLDSDATVYYAIGCYFERKELTQADLNSSSPYNTRKATGLPPGPISNPGSYSLYAALYPTDSPYYYFIYDAKAGFHRFSKTLAEHNAWADKLSK